MSTIADNADRRVARRDGDFHYKENTNENANTKQHKQKGGKNHTSDISRVLIHNNDAAVRPSIANHLRALFSR